MKRLSKRNDPRRRMQSFKKHTMLLLQPVLPATLAVLTWHFARKHGVCFSKEDEGALTGAVITTLGVAYSIVATLVFGSVWERYQKVVITVLEHDMHKFLLYRDERIPIVIHLFIGALSLPLLVMIGGLSYEEPWSGIAAVFSVTYVVAFYWIMVAELQDPAKSLWFAERIPQEWLTTDIDEHFNLGEKITHS